MFAVSPAAWSQRAAATSEIPVERTTTVVRADARTGKLVRRAIVSPPALTPDQAEAPAQTASNITLNRRRAVEHEVAAAAERHGVDPLLVHSVIRVESNYNPVAVSPKGAAGLMQLIPATARRFGVTDSFDVHDNIEAGVKYLKYLQEMFGNDRLAVAAYNAGESAVMRYGGVPPYRETMNYVKRVGQELQAARQLSAAAAPAPPAAPQTAGAATAAVPETRPVEAYVDESGRIHMRTR